MLELLAATGSLPAGADVNQLNPEFASVEKLIALFGSAENAADWMNRYACRLEDMQEVLSHKMQQMQVDIQRLIQIAEYYRDKEAALTEWITEPANAAAYYLELEKLAGEIDVNGIMNRVYQQNQPQAQIPQIPQMGMMANQNPAAIAAQYSQQAQTNLINRPVMPPVQNQMPGNASFAEMLENVHPLERFKIIDQLTAQGAFRGSRINLR